MNKHIITPKEFNHLVSDICRQITISNWRPDYIVGITRGGLFPAVLVSHYFDVPMHSLKISFRNGKEDCESNFWMSEDAFGYHRTDDLPGASNPSLRKNILIVDDINDTGATFNWLMLDWQSSCLPNDPAWENDIWNHNVKFASVVDNLSSKCRVGMDFWGMEVNKEENDIWLEFPYEDWWRK